MSKHGDRPAAFVASLEELVRRRDRAALAALRRGLGKPPGAAPELHRYVVPWLLTPASHRDADYYLVAALFADWHQGERTPARWEGSLGQSFRSLAAQMGGGTDGVERRFRGILACHRDDLPQHLRHAVSLLRTHAVPVDWVRLLTDLPRWDHLDRPVQRRWARDFWAAASPPSSEATTVPSPQAQEPAP
jgi:CRISPR type I-E-associated protein CasB/Cse2